MTKLKAPSLVIAATLLMFGIAQADHNSPWEAGSANMPNDIHNTRIETMDDDSDTFLDFVQMGGGSDSVNRFLTDSDTSTTSAGGNQAGSSRGGRS